MSLRSNKLVVGSEILDPSYDTFLIDATGVTGGILFTASNILNDGETYVIKRIDGIAGNAVTIQGFNSSQTIDGLTNLTLNPLQSTVIMSYSGAWLLLL